MSNEKSSFPPSHKCFVLFEGGAPVFQSGKIATYTPGAFCVFFNPLTNSVLVVKDRRENGKWGLPGGAIEFPDETPLDAALREAKEELNLSANKEKTQFVGHFGKWQPVFLFEAQEWSSGDTPFDLSGVKKQEDEISEWKMISLPHLFQKEVREIFYTAQRKMLGWWLAERLGVCTTPIFKSLEDPWENILMRYYSYLSE